MTLASEFTFDQALAVANTALVDRMQCQLSDVETLLLRGAWQGKTYENIADESAYSASYLRRNVGPKLWKTLSKALEQPVSKTNFREALERTQQQQQQAKLEHQERSSLGFDVPAYPTREDAQASQLKGALNLNWPLNSPSGLGAQTVERQSMPALPQPVAQTISALNSDLGDIADAASQSSQTIAGQLADQLTYRADWGEAIDVSLFFGRNNDLNQLAQMIEQDRCRLLAVLGMGGIGKTSLTVKLAQQVAHDFEFVIWRSLRNAPNLDNLVTDWLQFFSAQQVVDGDLKLLLQTLKNHRCLVVLDNMETILRAGERAGSFRQEYEAYGNLLRLVAEVPHQSCVVLTSREKPAEVAAFEGVELAVRSHVLKGAQDVAIKLLNAKGVVGSSMAQQQLCDRYSNSPLAMKIVATSIQDLYDGDVQQFLDQETNVFNGLQRLLDQHFQRLSPLERTVMFWLAINREWTGADSLAADILPATRKGKILETLESLSWRSLTERKRGTYTQQPVVMEYVTDQLVEAVVESLLPGQRPKKQGQMPLTQLFSPLYSHALIKTTVQDYVQASQRQLILDPVVEKLRPYGLEAIGQKLNLILEALQADITQATSYAAGNLLNLSQRLGVDLSGYDFSGLTVRQADLRTLPLAQVDFTAAKFAQTTFAQTFGSVVCVKFSRNGRWLATGDAANEIRLWQVDDGHLIRILKGHSGWITALAFSADDGYLVSGSMDYSVRMWDLKASVWDSTSADMSIRIFQGHTSIVWCVATSPDGRWVASGSDDLTAKIWDLRTGDCIHTLAGHRGWLRGVAFSPDGTMLATGSMDRTVRLWDVATGDCVQVLEECTPDGTQLSRLAEVWSVAFSPDGKLLACGGADSTIRVWHIEQGDCLTVLKGHSDQVWSIGFSADSQQLVSGSLDQTARLWDVTTGNCYRVIQGHSDQIWATSIHPSGELLATGSMDQTIKLWQLSTGKCLRTWQGYTNQVHAVTFNPTGDTLATGGDDTVVRLWDQQTGHCTKNLVGHGRGVWSVDFNPQGTLLASGSMDQTIKFWHVTSGRCIRTLPSQLGWVRALAFSPDGKFLAACGIAPLVHLWDVASGRCMRTFLGHRDQLWCLAFSPDGRQLATSGADQEIRLWDVATGMCQRVLSCAEDWIYDLAFEPDGNRLASGGSEGTVRIWDWQTGDCLQTFPGHRDWIYGVRWTQDGRHVTTASLDHTAMVWDVSTGTCTQVWQGHQHQVRAIATAPNTPTVATGSGDQTVCLWDMDTGNLQQQLRVPRPYEGMKITAVAGLNEAQSLALRQLGAVDVFT
ncbi:MAG: WD40 repeat domain-containing protein [Cyanobacteria bacterium P01_B01_bin.77]